MTFSANHTFFLNRAFALVFGTALLFSVAACDSGGSEDDDDDNGQLPEADFSLSISGDGVNESFDGFAYFGEARDPNTDEEAFVIFLSDEETLSQNQNFSYAIIGRASDRPGTGSHAFADLDTDDDDLPDDQFIGWVALFTSDGQLTSIFFSDSGTLDIDSSSDSRVEGDFTIQGTGFNLSAPDQELSVTITGDFDARSNRNVFVPGFGFGS